MGKKGHLPRCGPAASTGENVSTRAIQWLRKQGISFAVVTYDHQIKGAAFAAQATGFPLDRTVKTLVVDLGGGAFGLALMPGDHKLATKKLARVLGVKKAALADAPNAERLTGYRVGGISPFGIRRPLAVAMEASLMVHPRVLVNGGQRGIMLEMHPQDIAAGLNCRLGDLLVEGGRRPDRKVKSR
ncbi:MAG: aminoacyl-tRNA deacylase [Desulfobacterales bacterium]|nr:aminoacyl-tRNA deacylase [Desulfobacterales bacterium]